MAALVQKHGIASAEFRPTLEELFAKLRFDPKQFEKKHGKLKDYRAAPLRFNRTAVWRCVFYIDEVTEVVKVVALSSHDEAYDMAKQIGHRF